MISSHLDIFRDDTAGRKGYRVEPEMKYSWGSAAGIPTRQADQSKHFFIGFFIYFTNKFTPGANVHKKRELGREVVGVRLWKRR